MKSRTEALQTILAEQRAALIQQKQESQAASIQRKQESQAALIQQKQQDKLIEQMLQTFLTKFRQSRSSRTSRLISDTSEKKTSETKPCVKRATQQLNNTEKQSTGHRTDTIISDKSENLSEFDLAPPPPGLSFWNNPIEFEMMQA